MIKNQYCKAQTFTANDLSSIKGLYQAWLDSNPNFVVVSETLISHLAETFPRVNQVETLTFTNATSSGVASAFETWRTGLANNVFLHSVSRYEAAGTHYWVVNFYTVTTYDPNATAHSLLVRYSLPGTEKLN